MVDKKFKSDELEIAADLKLRASNSSAGNHGAANQTGADTIATISDTIAKFSMQSSSSNVQTETIRPEHVLNDKFEVLEKLGEGGMGSVFRARNKEIDREMAVKVMKPQWLGDDVALKRFEKEAAAAADLTHPNIAQVFGGSFETDSPYLFMEYVEGSNLAHVVEHNKCLELPKFYGIMLQICDALEYAHMREIVHRDLKPSNIIIKEVSPNHDLVKIVDFGIAKIAPSNESATQLTQRGEIFGSPMYMSPEQSQGTLIDNRSDLYSLGCIMYECLAGKPLFKGDNAIQILLQHINSPTKQLTEKLLGRNVPLGLVLILDKSLQKTSSRRYQSATELAKDLRAVQAGKLPLHLLFSGMDIWSSQARLALSVIGVFIVLALLISSYTLYDAMHRSDQFAVSAIKLKPPHVVRNIPNPFGTTYNTEVVVRREHLRILMQAIKSSKDPDKLNSVLMDLNHMMNPRVAILQGPDGTMRDTRPIIFDADYQNVLIEALNRQTDPARRDTIKSILANAPYPSDATKTVLSTDY